MPVIETKGAASSGGFGQFARRAEGAYIEDVFSTWLYTGNGSSQTITNGIDLSTKGGLVWIKARTNATQNHFITDTANGFTKAFDRGSSGTAGLVNVFSGSISTTTSGFALSGGDVYTNWATANLSGYNFVSWTFRKQAKFFDIVTYTGNGSSSRLINHSLGSAPGLVIIKATSTTSNWPVMFAPTSGNAYGFSNGFAGGGLNTNGAGYSLGSVSGVSTETQFRVGSSYWGAGSETNDSGVTYIAYVFANNAGGFGASGTENAITCGTYTGNGSTTGPFITLGYEPQFLLIKNRESGTYEDWVMVDTMRGLPVNGPAALLYADLANSEASTNPFINVSATGFQPVVSSSRINASGNNYMYMAIRRGPMRTPTSGTSVFGMQTYSDGSLGSAAPIVLGSSVGFPVDTAIAAIRTSGAANITKYVGDRLRGRPELKTPAVDAESNTDIVSWAWQAGVQVSTAGNWYYFDGSAGSRTFAAYFFRRAPGFFDVVCYTGTGANLTITHNLGAVPQMMWVKTRTGVFLWGVYDSFNGATKFMRLNGNNDSSAAANYFNNTSPTSSVFTVGTALSTVSENYVAYLFGSVSGVSKFGNYTGTGTTKQIDCGFTGGARFVLIKRTDTNGDWYVWDTARGIVAGNDPYLLLNSTTAEVTGTDYIDTLSSGFEISSTAPAAINANGGSYIFLAIA